MSTSQFTRDAASSGTEAAICYGLINAQDGLYVASHAFKVDGYNQAESEALLDELMAFCTQPEFVYAHFWDVGDVLLWDQRAVMHRGTPWPFDEPRTLSSICTSATEADGLDRIRMPVVG